MGLARWTLAVAVLTMVSAGGPALAACGNGTGPLAVGSDRFSLSFALDAKGDFGRNAGDGENCRYVLPLMDADLDIEQVEPGEDDRSLGAGVVAEIVPIRAGWGALAFRGEPRMLWKDGRPVGGDLDFRTDLALDALGVDLATGWHGGVAPGEGTEIFVEGRSRPLRVMGASMSLAGVWRRADSDNDIARHHGVTLMIARAGMKAEIGLARIGRSIGETAVQFSAALAGLQNRWGVLPERLHMSVDGADDGSSRYGARWAIAGGLFDLTAGRTGVGQGMVDATFSLRYDRQPLFPVDMAVGVHAGRGDMRGSVTLRSGFTF